MQDYYRSLDQHLRQPRPESARPEARLPAGQDWAECEEPAAQPAAPAQPGPGLLQHQTLLQQQMRLLRRADSTLTAVLAL